MTPLEELKQRGGQTGFAAITMQERDDLVRAVEAAQKVEHEFRLWSEDANDGEFAIWSSDRLMGAVFIELAPALRPFVPEEKP